METNLNNPILTAEAVKRLNQALIEVKLWNGCFNIASAVAEFARYKLELLVEKTHPSLAWQCGDKHDVVLVYWKGCSGKHIAIPDELQPLVERMQIAATMKDVDAARRLRQNGKAFISDMKEMGLV